MSRENHFYDLPIYRVSNEKYSQDMDNFIQDHLYNIGLNTKEEMDEFYKRNPDSKTIYYQHAWESFGGPWRYNEIIGYIRLYFLGHQIRGEYWFVNAKRVVKTRKKIISLQSFKVVPEIQVPINATNHEIYELIMKYINKAKKYLKKRYLDSRDFEKIGKFIDWKRLINE